jgi:hypothetical protein
MRSRSVGGAVAALCAFVLLSTSAIITGCSLPWTRAEADDGSQAAVNQAVYRLQAALGLSDGVVSVSSQPPLLGGYEVALRWAGGRADIDPETGDIRTILLDPPARKTGAAAVEADEETNAPTVPELEVEAKRMVSLLGWDAASLEARGFIAGRGETIEYNEVGAVYEKTWNGRDPEGVPNQGIIQVGLRAEDGSLHSFLFAPGPETVLDVAGAVTKDQAIKTAREAAAKSSSLVVSTTTTTAPPEPEGEGDQEQTTTTAEESPPAEESTTTTAAPREKATMVHMDNPAITGGKDLLVWVVDLPADKVAGTTSATVYVDAISNKALLVLAT